MRTGLGGDGVDKMTEAAAPEKASKSIDKTAAVATATATVQTGLGGDGGDKMTATATAQAWLVIRRRQQRDNGDFDGNGGGTKLAWLGGSGKTDRCQQKQRRWRCRLELAAMEIAEAATGGANLV